MPEMSPSSVESVPQPANASAAEYGRSLRWGWLAYALLAAISLAYLVITLVTAPDPAALHRYSLSTVTVHLLQLTIVIPVIVIWFIALWGSLRFKRYALSIYKAPDGRGLNMVSNGLLVLVSGLAISSLLQALKPKLAAAGFGVGWTILVNHVTLTLSLVAFAIMFAGALKLAGMVRRKGFWRWQLVIFVALIVLGAAYGLLVVHDPYRTATSDPAHYPSLYLSDGWILGTLILPYILTWYFGLMAAACLQIYRLNSPGLLYRQALSRLSSGLIVIIAASVAIQLLNVAAGTLTRLGLSSILALLYALIVIYALGHIFVVLGARRLTQIEEVR